MWAKNSLYSGTGLTLSLRHGPLRPWPHAQDCSSLPGGNGHGFQFRGTSRDSSGALPQCWEVSSTLASGSDFCIDHCSVQDSRETADLCSSLPAAASFLLCGLANLSLPGALGFTLSLQFLINHPALPYFSPILDFLSNSQHILLSIWLRFPTYVLKAWHASPYPACSLLQG